MKSWVCKVYLGQDMSLDELIEKDYLPPKVQTIGLTNHDLLGMAQEKVKF